MKRNIFLYALTLSFAFFGILHTESTIEDRIQGAIFGGLIGDALGRPTEFISSPEKIFATYPEGIKSFEDLRKFNLCWKNQVGQLYAPYTDDTAMTRVTLKVLIQAREENWDLDKTMVALAMGYLEDLSSPTGWSMPARAPGNSCLKGIKNFQAILNQRMKPGQKIWQAGESDAAGCGAVMRSHAFGVVFADDPGKAAQWAAEHSKITHGHPLSQAACAAMAAGTAYAIQGKESEFIADQMIAWAKKYDPAATRFNKYKNQQEKSCWGKMEDALSLALQGNVVRLAQSDYVFSDNKQLNTLFKQAKNNKIFHTYEGWAADDALAAAFYIFLVTPHNTHNAIALGVHTPGDSDSIASMAGALCGAYNGIAALQKQHDVTVYEGSRTLEQYGDKVAQMVKK